MKNVNKNLKKKTMIPLRCEYGKIFSKEKWVKYNKN